MKRQYNILEHYKYEDFTCIGGACKYSCCKYWNINIDDESYKKYKLSNFFTKDMLEKNFTKNKDKKMKFRLKKDGGCPLQSEDGFCDIHRNLGEEFLCRTCRIYPRGMNLVNNSVEKNLSTSCPEVVEKLIINTNKIEFNQEIQLIEEKNLYINERINTNKEGYIKYFWDIRIFTIDLLQNRNLSIEDRLIAIGIVYKKIEELTKNKEIEKIPAILKLYKEEFERGNIFGNIKKVIISDEVKISILNKLIITTSSNHDYIVLTKVLLESMNFNDSQELIKNYNLSKRSKYEEFLLEKEYIVENYLVNLAFANVMPFEENSEIFNKYLEMAVLYSLVKLYLLGTDEKEITEERVIKVITLLSRVINHNPTYIKDVVNYINSISDSEMNKLAILVTLLK